MHDVTQTDSAVPSLEETGAPVTFTVGPTKMSFQRHPSQISPRGMFDEVSPPGSQRFLLAAITAFAGRGYHATTTRDIASLAGASPAGMYTYFATKADLLYTMSLIAHEYVLRIMQEALDTETDPAARMRQLVRASVGYHADEHVVVRVVNQDFRALDVARLAEILQLRRQAKEMVYREVLTGADAGVFTVPDVNGASIAILRLVDVAPWYNERGPMTAQGLAEIYTDLVLRMLGVTPGAPASARRISAD